MKKLFIMALMVAAASSTYAQDVKSVLKAKSYDEAQSALNACISSLGNEDKAKGYNKLVELSLEKVNKENATLQENQMMKQMGQKGDKPVDQAGMNEALAKALSDAAECDKYDQLPNAKGKVSPKFHKKNQTALWNLRFNLINAGQDALQSEDNKTAFKYFSSYVESGVSPLFSDFDKTQFPDTYLGEVARVAGVLAYQDKNSELANKYIDIALEDTASYKEALNVKMALMQQSMNTREDSVKCVNTFEQLYAKDKNNENIFSNLATLYGSLGMKDKQCAIINDRLANNSNDFMALAIKGQNEMGENKWDEAIADFKKATAVKEDALVLTWLGFCLTNKAAGLAKEADQKPLLEETKDYLEKARQIDPNQERANWRYLLYSTYYNLYGENDARTKELAQ
jgi:tetratricopeptide (TPR) repeat protein